MSEEVARKLLEINAVQFNFAKPFRWSSGWNSPIYTDCRMTLSYPDFRTFIKNSFARLIRQIYPTTEVIAGVATAGISQAALIADTMQLPMLYVRAKPKEHGKENLIEGKITAGQKVVIVEDIISTGGSCLQAAQALREAGAEVLGVVAILTYGFDFADEQFAAADLSYETLSDYTQLLVQFFKREDVSESTMASLHEWRKNPSQWQG
ncbi:MAG: orotate phosphoribosyltransferase [Microscillaceae bacterium]|nr:orotate phosphoribosyltransferase [Microscillaceae bacterium]